MPKKKKKKTIKDKKTEKKEKKKKPLGRKAKNAIYIVILFALTLLSLVAFVGAAGVVGESFIKAITWLLGGAKYLVPVFFLVAAVSILRRIKKPVWVTLTGASLFIFTFSIFIGILFNNGGAIGNGLANITIQYLDQAGALIVVSALFLISLILAFNLSLGFLFKRDSIANSEKKPGEEKENEISSQQSLDLDQKKESIFEKFSSKKQETRVLHRPIFRLKKLSVQEKKDAKKDNEVKTVAIDLKEDGYAFPPLDILSLELDDKESVKKSEIDGNNEIIKDTLDNFDIPVAMGDVSVGPTVTQYTLKPSKGVKLSQIVALHNDLSLALAAHPLRLEAPIPGKSWAGVEVPNKIKHIVKLRNLLEEKSYQKEKNYLTIPLGKNVAGIPVYGNLAKMPHLLIAGATGTGKSVGIHNILTSFLYQNSPKTLKLILVDPKRVELTAYNGIPHLLTPVIVDAQKAINSLKWAISEMERRYELLSDIGARDLTSYNEKVAKIPQKEKETLAKHKSLPYIVIVIDELADIMMTFGRETEAVVVRLAQMARAVGIHLILSTQRPSVEVITGLIKANITNRIAFQVASQIDSRTILDMAGAEKLLGNGDMLFLTGDSSKPTRIQGAFILEREVKKVVDFIKSQNYEDEQQDYGIDTGNENQSDMGDLTDYKYEDDLYEDAKKIVIESKKASASLLQRRLRIGYARAARMLDMLEGGGIIGPSRGSKPREIITKKEENEL
jgi:DNA segregation ATPase FtsK/SpoIIIE, S-DNA-T family